jgi:hypothetical protein
MVTSPKGLGPEKYYAGEDRQHIQKTDPSYCQRGLPRKTWGSTPRRTDWLTVSRNVTLTCESPV